MKKVISAIFLSAVVAVPAVRAAYVSPEEAMARLSADRSLSPSIHGSVSNNFKLSATIGNLYVFEGQTGYIVLPDDDAAPALLGYSERSAFDADVNPNLAYWLECLNKEIDYIKSTPSTPAFRQPKAVRDAIEPMITTLWNQSSPFNDDCPVQNGTRCVTGCVATAMAQVLNYHAWPVQGTGTHSYSWNGTQLSFDYGNTTFEWNLMMPVYDSSSPAESAAAVAKLMYACGVSVDMNYTASSSGAQSSKIPGAIIDYFNYDKSAWLAERDAFGIAEWEDLIYNEIYEGRPVLYGGQGSGGGHEFVCDGYDGNGYFHFNWGWGGMSDGYFLLTALNPGSLGTGGGAGGYNMQQDAVIGVRPAQEGSEYTYVMYNIKDFSGGNEHVELGSYQTMIGAFMNGSAVTLDNLTCGVSMQSVDGGVKTYCKSVMGWSSLPPSSYYQQLMFMVPADLADGDYVIKPAFRVGDGDWQEMRSYLSVNGSVLGHVEGGSMAFSTPDSPSVTVSDITTMETLYVSRKMPMSFTVTNSGEDEYVGTIVPTLFDAGGKLVYQADSEPVDLIGGASQTFTDVPVTFRYRYVESFTPGSYKLAFCDANRNIISETVDVELAEAPAQNSFTVTAFDLLSTTPVSDKSAVKFNVGLKCTGGYFSSAPRIVVFPYIPGASVSSVYSVSTPDFFLLDGQSASKEVIVDLSGLENGKYFAKLYNGSTAASSKQIIFELTTPTTGIGSVAADAEENEEIYNLNGVKCERPLIPGLYIINGVKTVVK